MLSRGIFGGSVVEFMGKGVLGLSEMKMETPGLKDYSAWELLLGFLEVMLKTVLSNVVAVSCVLLSHP